MSRNDSIIHALSVITIVAAAALLVLGVLSFVRLPAYEHGASMVIELFKDVILVAIGVKGAAYVPGEKEPPAPPPEGPSAGIQPE